MFIEWIILTLCTCASACPWPRDREPRMELSTLVRLQTTLSSTDTRRAASDP